MHVHKSMTVRRPREAVYAFWRDFSNLPRFMINLQSIDVEGDSRRSHWLAGPPGHEVRWDAEIVDDRPGERLSWRALPESDMRHRGAVTFRDAPGDRGTEVSVEFEYDPPAGTVETAVARLFGADPAQEVRADLRRFKQIMEIGEIVCSDGSPEGAGQGARKQRVAQPQEAEVVR